MKPPTLTLTRTHRRTAVTKKGTQSEDLRTKRFSPRVRDGIRPRLDHTFTVCNGDTHPPNHIINSMGALKKRGHIGIHVARDTHDEIQHRPMIASPYRLMMSNPITELADRIKFHMKTSPTWIPAGLNRHVRKRCRQVRPPQNGFVIQIPVPRHPRRRQPHPKPKGQVRHKIIIRRGLNTQPLKITKCSLKRPVLALTQMRLQPPAVQGVRTKRRLKSVP